MVRPSRPVLIALAALLVVGGGLAAVLVLNTPSPPPDPHGPELRLDTEEDPPPPPAPCPTDTFVVDGRTIIHPDADGNNCFLRVEGGTFLRGAQHADAKAPGYDADADDDEGPPKPTTISTFWMQNAEVSNGQYVHCVAMKKCRPQDGPDRLSLVEGGRHLRPVTKVSWQGAHDYCALLGGRLPTEAEWEFAARGTDARRYPWGDAAASCQRAFMKEPGQPGGCGQDHAREVWETPQNGFHPGGFLNLAGNVLEWTADWYDDQGYAKAADKDPKGPEAGTRRVVRGGGWHDEDPKLLRSAARNAQEPDQKLDDVGFRCVLDHPPQ